jgi:hypothetical protein
MIPAAVGGFVLAATLASSAFAHHGWNWAEAEQTRMTGKIVRIYVGPPHPQIEIDTADGRWTVDFGNPRQTADAGFVESSAKEGDTVAILGNRSSKAGEKLIKAVRATINGRNYDFYPERLPK